MQLTETLKQATWMLHQKAEKHSFMQLLLTGNLPHALYVEYLQQLLPVYMGIKTKAVLLGCSDWLFLHEIDRTQAIIHDLTKLGVTLSPRELNRYAQYLSQITTVEQLLAHYYVRYLGDLHGGQIIAKLLKKKYQYKDTALHFYQFKGSAKVWITKVRAALNQYLAQCDHSVIADEAQLAFKENMALMDDVLEIKISSIPSRVGKNQSS